MLEGHTARVGALAWNGDSLSSGSRDRLILQRDIRTPAIQAERRLVGHRQEVCGLKWSPDNQWLASGGNDNKLFVWAAAGGSGAGNTSAINTNTAASSSSPVHSFTGIKYTSNKLRGTFLAEAKYPPPPIGIFQLP